MDELFFAISILVAFHAYSFALWLKRQENIIGAFGVFLLIITGLALTLYRILQAG